MIGRTCVTGLRQILVFLIARIVVFMKTFLVTGASGYLGHSIVNNLATSPYTRVIAILGRPEDYAFSLFKRDNVIVCPCSSLFSVDFGPIDVLIHTAFSRGENLSGLANSIHLTESIINLVNTRDIRSLINISSQGVYKTLEKGETVAEDGLLEPGTAYGLAKLCVEKMISLGCTKKFSNIRMASLARNARFLDFFVSQVLSGKSLSITTPNRYASIMDVSDAVTGILSVAGIDESSRLTTYNLGPGRQRSILDYANLVNKVAQDFGFHPVPISIEDSGINTAICMDCSRLKGQTKWDCQIDDEMMIRKLFENKLNV